jgi:hypothetical protein
VAGDDAAAKQHMPWLMNWFRCRGRRRSSRVVRGSRATPYCTDASR